MHTLGARVIWASRLADRVYSLYDRTRSLLVTSFASDGVLAAYNDLAYASTGNYVPGSARARSTLFHWEEDIVRRVFPEPPARVLIGGAGGGRETFVLAARGYDVTAFEPSPGLVHAMKAHAEKNGAGVEVLIGRYETMPIVRQVDTGAPVDLSQREPFDVAMLGWSSFSHIRRRENRIATLRAFGALARGPVVVSFLVRQPATGPRHPLSQLSASLGLRDEGDNFSTQIGFYHLSGQEELAGEIEAAGLEIVDASYDDGDGHWPWVAARARR